MSFLGQTLRHPFPGITSIATAPDRELTVHAHAILVAFFQSNVNGTRVCWMDRDRKAKARGQFPFPKVDPIFATIVAAIDAAVVLLINHIWVRRVHHHFMDALPELR